MKKALNEAKAAYKKLEAPVGAVIVRDGIIVAKAHNLRESLQDATAHAEMLVIKKACKKLGSWRLLGCDMYVSLEPCPMCAGAILTSRIENLYFGAYDKKGGAAGSVVDLFAIDNFNHKVNITGGIMQNECGEILSNFFKELRK